MGSYQSLGYYKNIPAHPAYQHLRASERMLKPADPASLQYLYDIYAELISTTRHELFNINCDEAYDLDRGPELEKIDRSPARSDCFRATRPCQGCNLH